MYWPNDSGSNHETKINAITLTGSLLGQVIFGFLADRYGRRKLYGLELIVIVFGTLGFVESSAGYNGSMNIMGWIMFWRFFVGLGIVRFISFFYLFLSSARALKPVFGFLLVDLGEGVPTTKAPDSQLSSGNKF